MGQLKCKLGSSHVMYNGLLCPWSTSIIFAILKRGSTSLIIFGADVCCCDRDSHYLLMTFNLEKKNYTLVFLYAEYSSYECKLQISISLRKEKSRANSTAFIDVLFCPVRFQFEKDKIPTHKYVHIGLLGQWHSLSQTQG